MLFISADFSCVLSILLCVSSDNNEQRPDGAVHGQGQEPVHAGLGGRMINSRRWEFYKPPFPSFPLSPPPLQIHVFELYHYNFIFIYNILTFE